MELAPPSYEEATGRDPWKLIATYLETKDLLSCLLVCKSWYQEFLEQLWSNPVKHCLHENEPIHDALRRFLRSLPNARFGTRSTTHTLNFPADFEDVYESPGRDWLRYVFHYLPTLQSLLVGGLPYFDHASLIAVGEYDAAKQSTRARVRCDNLRLLDASNCSNASAQGLGEVLCSTPFLVYLDLSGTRAAANAEVLHELKNLKKLKVLKLQDVGLRPETMRIVASSVGMRLKSLDVRLNRLYESGLNPLLESCLKVQESQATWDQISRLHPPSSHQHSVQETWRSTNAFDAHVRRALTAGKLNELYLEHARETGIVHFQLNGNPLMDRFVTKVLACPNLLSLDIGAVRRSNNLEWSQTFYHDGLRVLRVHYSNLMNSQNEPPAYQDVTNVSEGVSIMQLRVLEDILRERKRRREDARRPKRPIVPASFPNLSTIIISHVPERTSDTAVANSLISFIKACAKEASLADRQAQLDYSLPPGRRTRNTTVNAFARSLFPLGLIILETTAIGVEDELQMFALRDNAHAATNQKSTTEDSDGEAFWSASAADFSFFEEDEKGFGEHHSDVEAPDLYRRSKVGKLYNVLDELSSFRKKAKEAYNEAVKHNRDPETVEGYWAGKIEIHRMVDVAREIDA